MTYVRAHPSASEIDTGGLLGTADGGHLPVPKAKLGHYPTDSQLRDVNQPGPAGAAEMRMGRHAGLDAKVPVPRNEPFALRQLTVAKYRYGSVAIEASDSSDIRCPLFRQ